MGKAYTGLSAAISGAAVGGVNDGLKGALIGGGTALAFFGVGEAFAGTSVGYSADGLAGLGGKVVAHGVVGGTSAVIAGGEFHHGFLSAGVSMAFTPAIGNILPDAEYIGDAAQTAAAAVVGGTASQLSGGSFANGAITAGFGYLFNQVAHKGNNTATAEEQEQFLADLEIEVLRNEKLAWGAMVFDDESLLRDYRALAASGPIGRELVYRVQKALISNGSKLEVSISIDRSIAFPGNSSTAYQIELAVPQPYESNGKFVKWGPLEVHVHELFHTYDQISGTQLVTYPEGSPMYKWQDSYEYRAVRYTNAFRKEQGNPNPRTSYR